MLMAALLIQLPAAWTSAHTDSTRLCNSCALLNHASEAPGITDIKQSGWWWVGGHYRRGQEP